MWAAVAGSASATWLGSLPSWWQLKGRELEHLGMWRGHQLSQEVLGPQLLTENLQPTQGSGCCQWWCAASESCPTLCDPMDCSPPGSSVLGFYILLQGIFPTQGLKLCLLRLLRWQAGSLSLELPWKGVSYRLCTSKHRWFLFLWTHRGCVYMITLYSVWAPVVAHNPRRW